LKILITGDWSTDNPQLLQSYAGFDVSLWFVPAQGLDNHVMARAYSSGAVGALIVFDFTRPPSLATATRWKQALDARQPMPCVLVGNRVHLCNSAQWSKTDVEMDLFVIENGFINFLKTQELNTETANRAVAALVDHIQRNGIQPGSQEMRGESLSMTERTNDKCF
jgi:signal recognition particle receptor subunit beta